MSKVRGARNCLETSNAEIDDAHIRRQRPTESPMEFLGTFQKTPVIPRILVQK
jgi:hypothetical protein